MNITWPFFIHHFGFEVSECLRQFKRVGLFKKFFFQFRLTYIFFYKCHKLVRTVMGDQVFGKISILRIFEKISYIFRDMFYGGVLFYEFKKISFICSQCEEIFP